MCGAAQPIAEAGQHGPSQRATAEAAVGLPERCSRLTRAPCRALAVLPAVRDSRRAHLPGGSIKMTRGQYDVKAKDEALEVGACSPACLPAREPASSFAALRCVSVWVPLVSLFGWGQAVPAGSDVALPPQLPPLALARLSLRHPCGLH